MAHPVSIRLPKTLHSELRDRSKAEGITFTAALHLALSTGLQQLASRSQTGAVEPSIKAEGSALIIELGSTAWKVDIGCPTCEARRAMIDSPVDALAAL